MDKAGLRRAVREGRRHRTASPDFVGRVLSRIPAGSSVCAYVNLPGEPPTEAIIHALLARDDQVFLPVAGSGLEWVDARSSQPWQAWGVPGRPDCPSPRVVLPQVSVILVPALALDCDGRRLGQGGGYYDRFVPTQPTARSLALIWSGEVLADVGAQPHDITVDQWVIADD